MAHENFYDKNQPFPSYLNFYVQIYSTEVVFVFFFFLTDESFYVFFFELRGISFTLKNLFL